MSREYRSASIEVTLKNGEVFARLHGYFTDTPQIARVFSADVWPLSPSITVLEYMARCDRERRHNPEMSSEQAEKVALLAWVKDMEAVPE